MTPSLLILRTDDGESSAATTTRGFGARTLDRMSYLTDAAAPQLVAEAFVRGERRREIALTEFRGSWTVVALGARRADVLQLADLEEAFAANGAIVVAATPDDWYSTAFTYSGTRVRFPILTGVAESRRLTLFVDPAGVVRLVGLDRSGRQSLALLEARLAA